MFLHECCLWTVQQKNSIRLNWTWKQMRYEKSQETQFFICPFPLLFQTKQGVSPQFHRDHSVAVVTNWWKNCWLDVRSTGSSWRRPVHASVIWVVPGSNPHFLSARHTLPTALRGAAPPWYRWPSSKVRRLLIAVTATWGSTRSVCLQRYLRCRGTRITQSI